MMSNFIFGSRALDCFEAADNDVLSKDVSSRNFQSAGPLDLNPDFPVPQLDIHLLYGVGWNIPYRQLRLGSIERGVFEKRLVPPDFLWINLLGHSI